MDLKNLIISKIDNKWTDLEKARFIYIELANIFSFNTTFQNTNDLICTKLFTQKVSIENIKDKNIICRTWSQIYSSLLNEVNIKNKIINTGHQFVEFYIDDITYVADATHGTYTDLARIKYNDDTEKFGKKLYLNKALNLIDNSSTWKEELDSIDKKVNRNYSKKQELLKIKQRLSVIHNEQYTTLEKLDILFTIVGNLCDGYYESKDFIHHLEYIALTEEELKNVGAIELKKTNKDYSVDIIQCIYIKGEEPIYYLLKKNNEVNKVTKEQIIELSKYGYGISSKTIPGIIYTKKFVPGKVSTSSIYKLYRKALSIVGRQII